MVHRLPAFPGFRRPIRSVFWLGRTVWGIGCTIVLLALLAAVPVLNMLALGYLLEAEGRVARTGKLRYAFPLLSVAPRIGMAGLLIFLALVPIRILATQIGVASDLDAPQVRGMLIGLRILQVVVALFLCFMIWLLLRPVHELPRLRQNLSRLGFWKYTSAAVDSLIRELEIRRHFMLGLKGFACAAIWLVIPMALLTSYYRNQQPAAAVLSFLGGFLAIPILGWLPLLQANLAATGDFRAGFQVKRIRRLIARTPLVWVLNSILVSIMAFPLYFAKVRLPAQDAMWLVTLIFIVLIYPARILSGWTYHRATIRRKAFFGLRWASKSLMFPLLAVYVLFIYFTPFFSEAGREAIFENHAFMLPSPF